MASPSPSPSSGKDLDEKAQRVRSLLASYYSLDGEDGESGGGEGDGYVGQGQRERPSHAKGKVNLDSDNFDCSSYFHRLLEQTRLDELLDREVKLQSEVKQCDGELQSLVYENYSKFIAATDTIRNMRTKVDGMETKMSLVKDKIKTIAEKNAVVDGKMEMRRARFDELNTVRDVMSKLNEVFELPQKCRLSMERGALGVAVKYVSSSKPFLEMHANEGNAALSQVKGEMEDCQKELVGLLKEKLRSDPDNNVDVINFLRQLGETVTELEDAFLSSSKVQLEDIASKATKVLEEYGCMGNLPQTAEPPASEVVESFSTLEASFIPSALKLQQQYRGMFLSEGEGMAVAVDNAGKFDKILETVLSSAVATTKKFVLTHPVKSLVSPKVLLEVLTTIDKTFETVQRNFRQFDEIHQGILGSIECSLRNYVGGKFMELEKALMERSTSFGSSGEGTMSSNLQRVTDSLCKAVEKFLVDMQGLQRDGSTLIGHWQDAFVMLVEEGCNQTLLSIEAGLRTLESPERKSEEDSLFFSRLATNYADVLVPYTEKVLGNVFVRGGQASERDSRRRALVESFASLSDFHLEKYVALKGRGLSQLIRISMLEKFDWLSYEHEAEEVYPVFKKICEDIRAIEAVVSQVISEDSRKMALSKEQHQRNPSTSRVERNVDRLFAEKIQIFGAKVDAERGAILCGITKIAIKSLIECIRLSSMNLKAHKLIQVSLVYLRSELREKILGEDNVVEFLLDEAQSALVDRCIEEV
ncbi:vacuolar protein sorting-associated protein [Chloropicon primus]|nr:vacuolar protein sorting-associated protein [Chloropicon primus]